MKNLRERGNQFDARLIWGSVGVVAVVSMVLPFVLNSYAIDIVDDMLLWATLALGLNIVAGYAGLLDLGYIAFYAIGGYTFGILSSDWHWNLWWTLPIAVILVATAAVIIGFPTLRLKSDYLAIMTLGFGEIIYICANNLNQLTGGPNALYYMATPHVFGIALTQPSQFYWPIAILLVVTIWAVYRLRHSFVGRAWLAMRHDDIAARSTGVNLVQFKLLAYALGATWAGLAGALFAAKQTIVSPQSFEFSQSFYVLAALILGGLGSLPGAIVGGFLYIVISEAFQGIGQTYSGLIFSVALLLVVLIRPGGIWPARPIRRGVGSKEQPSGNVSGWDLLPPTPYQPSGRPILVVDQVQLQFGGVVALMDMTCQVEAGEILAIIGPNGAGKTSLLNVLSGFVRPQHGAVWFEGKNISRSPSYDRIRQGMARTFQTPRLFQTMTIRENLIQYQHNRFHLTWRSGLWPLRSGERRAALEADAWLHTLGLTRYADVLPQNLPYGAQRLCEIGGCLASHPRLLLLDEPAAGMNESETRTLATLIRTIRDHGITIVLIEHDMTLVTAVADRILALDQGRPVVMGMPDEVLRHPQVVESFLGTVATVQEG